MTTLVAARRLYRAINRKLGFPRLGRRSDGTIARRADGSPKGITWCRCKPRKHPTLSRWAFEVDSVLRALQGQTVVMPDASVYTFDFTDEADTDIEAFLDVDTSADEEPVPES